MTTVDLILPCRNESAAIPWLASRVPASVNVILCDNDSVDLSRALARKAGWSVTRQPGRYAVGNAILNGIRRSHADIVCVIDCDGTIDPGDIPSLIAPIASGDADVTVGDRSRFAERMPIRHRIASAARDALLTSAYFGWPLSDLGSARAFRRSILSPEEYSGLHAGLGWNLDFTLAALERVGTERLTVVELPYHRRIGRSQVGGSARGALRATFDTIQTVLKWRQRKQAFFQSDRRLDRRPRASVHCHATTL